MRGIEVTEELLDLGDMGIGDISGIKGLKNLIQLYKFSLWSNKLTKIKELYGITKLNTLEFNSNAIFFKKTSYYMNIYFIIIFI